MHHQSQPSTPRESSKKGSDPNTNTNNGDEGSTLYYIEKAALELEKTFVYTLKVITREYLLPLRSFLKSQLKKGLLTPPQEEMLQNELNIIFEGTESLFTASCTGLTQLNQAMLARKRFWLASAYESYPGYFEAYAKFLIGQERGIKHLRIIQSAKSTSATYPEYLLRSEMIRIRKDLQARGLDRAWPGDLLWFCSARSTHLLRLAGQQRNLHGALSESQKAWVGAHYFSRNRANVVSPGKIAREVERLQGSAMKALAWTPDVERSYKRLEAISAAAGRLEAGYQTLDISRTLGDPYEYMPSNPSRIYLGRFPCVMIDNAVHYGLSQEVPVWMLRFSDGFGAAVEKEECCSKDGSKGNGGSGSANVDPNCLDERYVLTCWYSDGTATLTQVADPRGTRVVYKAVSAVMPPSSMPERTELPPGWKCVEKSRQKAYVYEPLELVLKAPPTFDAVAAANESERYFAVVNEDYVRTWTDFADEVCRHRIRQQQKEAEAEKEAQGPESQHQRSSSLESSAVSASSASMSPSGGSLGMPAGQGGADGKEETSPLCVGGLGPYKLVGSDIEEIVRYEGRVYRGAYTPLFMRLAMNSIVARGLGDEGIFRIGWEQKALDEMHARLDTGRYLTLEGKPPHFACNGLKLLIRESSTSLIPSPLFGKFVSVMDLPEDKRPAAFAALLRGSGVSETRYKVIRDLFHFLHIVAGNSEYNQMQTSNLAIIFAVSVFWESDRMRSDLGLITRSNEVVKSILNNFSQIFGYPVLNSATPRPLAIEPFVGLHNKFVNGKVPFRTLVPIHRTSSSSSSSSSTPNFLMSIDRDGVVSRWVATKDASKCGSFVISHKDFLCAAAIGRYLWVSLPNKGGIAVYDAEAALSSASDASSSTPCTPVAVLDTPNVMCILFNSGYGSVWCGAENSIHIFSAETLEKYGVVEESGFITAITAVGETVWCGVYKKDADQQEIHVWDSATSKLVAAFPAHTARITALCATAAGTVWSGASNGVVSVWMAASYKRARKIVHHGTAVNGMCSFGGQVWSAAREGGGGVSLWSVESNEYVGELRGYQSEAVHSVVSVEVDKDEWFVWTGSSDKSICVWKSIRLPKYFYKRMEC